MKQSYYISNFYCYLLRWVSTNTQTSKGLKMSKSQQANEHPLKDSDTLITCSMLPHISPAQKDKYALMLKEDGNKLFKEKKFKEAIQFYSAAIGFKEDHVFYSNRSVCFAGLKDYHKVIEDTTAALNLKPDFMKCLVRRAAAYEKVEKYEEAMVDWLYASLYEPGEVFYSQSFLSFKDCMQMAMVGTLNDMTEETASQLPSADYIFQYFAGFDKELTVEGLPEDPTKLKPDSGDFYLISGMKKMYVKDSNRYVEADSLFTKALSAYQNEFKADPNNAVLQRKLGIAYEYVFVFKSLKDDDTSELDWLKAIEFNPLRSRCHVHRGYTLLRDDRVEEAEDALKTAAAVAPKSAEAHYHLGLLFERLYDVAQKKPDADKAREHYTKAKLYRPDNVQTLIRLMQIALITNDLDGWKKLDVLGNTKFARSPEFANYRGDFLRDANNWIGAMGQFQLAIVLSDIAPGASIRVEPIINAVDLLLNDKSNELELDVTAAKEMLDKAIKIDPRSDHARLSMAQLKKNEGKDEEVVALYKEAAVLSPSFGTRKIVLNFAFAEAVEMHLKKFPALHKRFHSLNLTEHLPTSTNPTKMLMDMFGLECPCCDPCHPH